MCSNWNSNRDEAVNIGSGYIPMSDPDWCMAMEETCEDVEGIYCKIKLQIEIEKDKT